MDKSNNIVNSSENSVENCEREILDAYEGYIKAENSLRLSIYKAPKPSKINDLSKGILDKLDKAVSLGGNSNLLNRVENGNFDEIADCMVSPLFTVSQARRILEIIPSDFINEESLEISWLMETLEVSLGRPDVVLLIGNPRMGWPGIKVSCLDYRNLDTGAIVNKFFTAQSLVNYLSKEEK